MHRIEEEAVCVVWCVMCQGARLKRVVALVNLGQYLSLSTEQESMRAWLLDDVIISRKKEQNWPERAVSDKWGAWGLSSFLCTLGWPGRREKAAVHSGSRTWCTMPQTGRHRAEERCAARTRGGASVSRPHQRGAALSAEGARAWQLQPSLGRRRGVGQFLSD